MVTFYWFQLNWNEWAQNCDLSRYFSFIHCHFDQHLYDDAITVYLTNLVSVTTGISRMETFSFFELNWSEWARNVSMSVATVTPIEIYCRSLIGNVSPFIYFLLFPLCCLLFHLFFFWPCLIASYLASSPSLLESCSHARFTCHQRHQSKPAIQFKFICWNQRPLYSNWYQLVRIDLPPLELKCNITTFKLK